MNQICKIHSIIELRPKSISYMRTVFAVIVYLVLFSGVHAQTCDVSNEVRQNITRLLCGEFANDEEYKIVGEDCAARSFTPRIEDSVSHLTVLDACGYEEFSDEYERALVKFSGVMERLYPCVGVDVDLALSIPAVRTRLLRSRGAPICNSQLRSRIEANISQWRGLVEELSGSNFESQFLELLGLKQDQYNNITELN